MTEKTRNIFVIAILAVTLFSLAIWAWLRPGDDYSDSERRVLASFPELTWDEIISGDFMTDFEDYTLDQFPIRDTFRTIKSAVSLGIFNRMDNNDVFISGGHISKLEYPLSYNMLENACKRFAHIHNKYLAGKDIDTYFSIVPDKNYFIAPESGHLMYDYEELVNYMKSNTQDFMKYIDIFPLLSLDDYYTTDTHWRQENIIDVAQKIAAEMGATVGSSYTENILDNPFYGVYYGQAALPFTPDQIKYLTNDILDNCIVTSYDTGKPVVMDVYDMKAAYGKDPYEMFLSGTEALFVIENPACTTGKELVVFRDSFGSSLVPLLVEGYSKITVVDIRYIASDMVGMFVKFTDQDVLFLYSTILLNNSIAFK